MERIFIKNGWTKVKMNCRKDLLNLPNISGVYAIYANTPNKRLLIYIGVSKNLQKRLTTHPVLKLIFINRKEYRIDIMWKDFGNYGNNLGAERYLIHFYIPPFNGTCDKERKQKGYGDVPEMWEDLGVNDVKYKLSEILNVEL